MKVGLLPKTLSKEIMLRLKVTMHQVKMENVCFEYFCRFATRALTLRAQNTYIYGFQALFDFCIFLSHFLWVFEARSKLILN